MLDAAQLYRAGLKTALVMAAELLDQAALDLGRDLTRAEVAEYLAAQIAAADAARFSEPRPHA